MSDDAADVQRVLSGDVDAYAKLVDRYYDRCARFAIRMLGNRDDAEDALQSTFLRAYRALGRYQERDRFSAWLYRILVNQCRSIAARRSHRERVIVRVRLEPRPRVHNLRWRWILEPRSLPLSPLIGAALAAGLVGIGILLGHSQIDRGGQHSTGRSDAVAAPRPPLAPHDTVI